MQRRTIKPVSGKKFKAKLMGFEDVQARLKRLLRFNHYLGTDPFRDIPDDAKYHLRRRGFYLRNGVSLDRLTSFMVINKHKLNTSKGIIKAFDKAEEAGLVKSSSPKCAPLTDYNIERRVEDILWHRI